MVTVPLMLLAIPSVVIGFMTIQPMLFGDFFKDAITINTELHPAMEKFAEEFHGWFPMALHAFSTAPFWLALSGAVMAWYMYLINPAVAGCDRPRPQAGGDGAGEQVLHGLVQ